MFRNSDEIQSLIELSLKYVSRSLGFLAEIESNRWVYKGTLFKYIAKYERKEYSDKYLRMIGLF